MSRPSGAPDETSDVVIVGGGASGLSLAHHLAATGTSTVTLVEAPDGPRRSPERTWCYWERGTGDFAEAVSASWSRLRVHGTDGRTITVDPSPLRYRMLRSTAFERLVHSRLSRSPGSRVLRATADTVHDTSDGAEVHCTTPDGRTLTLRARHVFDSRPLRSLPPARTQLMQHFRGWFVRTDADRFDPAVADLMDFRVPQPRHGLAFGYTLPLAPGRALVEYTEFSRAPLTTTVYEAEDVATVVGQCGLVDRRGQRSTGELGVLDERPARRQRQRVAEGEPVARLRHPEVHQIGDRGVEPVRFGAHEPATEVLHQLCPGRWQRAQGAGVEDMAGAECQRAAVGRRAADLRAVGRVVHRVRGGAQDAGAG